MSVRENLELYGLQDEGRYVELRTSEMGATKHTDKADAYIMERLPFYAPRRVEDHLSILSFNNAPLPDSLVDALVDHPELFPDDVLIRWTQQQELILEATPGHLRGQKAQR